MVHELSRVWFKQVICGVGMGGDPGLVCVCVCVCGGALVKTTMAGITADVGQEGLETTLHHYFPWEVNGTLIDSLLDSTKSLFSQQH